MPIFVPVVEELGYDPVWFGVLFCMNMQVSYLSPALRPGLPSTSRGWRRPRSRCRRSSVVWPFIALQIIGLLLVLFFPDIALFLPRLLD